MTDREIKYRQAMFYDSKFHHWHYWGFIDGVFVAPLMGGIIADYAETGLLNITFGQAHANSYQFTGRYDVTTWDELSYDEKHAWCDGEGDPLKWPGREVYEGDRVTIRYGCDGSVILTGIVEYIPKYQQFQIREGIHGTFEFEPGSQTMTIVGNIVEQPEGE